MKADTGVSMTATGDSRPAAAEQIAFYRWQQMGTLVDDHVLDAFAVTAEPGQVAAELLRRYSDIMTRLTLYTPYPIDAAVTRQIATDLQGA